MKKLTLFALALIISLSINHTAIASEKEPEAFIIETYESDVTGDGVDETIELKGILFSESASYYREIWAEITSKHDEHWKITYGGGYEPVLQFVDLNHDQINDIFYQSPTGGSGGLYTYQLNTLANEKLTDIPLPEQRYIKGSFQENFNVTIQITPEGKPIVVDVKDRADDYIRLGIYDTEGNLLKPKSVMIDPIAFYDPVLISKSKGYGLKSYQQISGAYHADQLGTIETLWYYEDNEWIILKTDWVPTT